MAKLVRAAVADDTSDAEQEEQEATCSDLAEGAEQRVQ